MSSQSEQPSFILTQRLADGTVEWIRLEGPERVATVTGGAYALIDRADYEAPQTLVARRQGDDLVLEVQATEVLVLEGFFVTADAAFHPTPDVAGGAGPFSGAPVTPDSQEIAGSPAGEQVVWAAEGIQVAAESGDDDEPPSRTDPDSDDGGSGMLWAGVGGGLALLALAAGGGGGGGGGSGGGGGGGGTPPPTTPEPDPVNNTVEGTVVAGPVVEGNGLSVQAFEADGTTQLGQAQVDDDGNFSIEVGDYRGAVILRVVDADDGEDYLDEASEDDKDLNADLGAVVVVNDADSPVFANINPLTTLAASLAEREAGVAAPTQQQVNQVNAAIAELFGLSDLHDVTVVPVNGGAYDPGNDPSPGETYGAILAAFSGATFDNGGNSQETIDDVLAGLGLSGGAATLSAEAQVLLMGGAQIAEAETGESVGDIVVSVVDSAPLISSGSMADIDENSGTGETVYTGAATDAGAVTWSLANSGDAAALSIDADTGEVTLTGNPDHETKASYTFTVVATDNRDNSSEQTVSLEINNLDEEPPTITSGANAGAIDENSGSGQLIYTATADDSADISGGVTFSLAAEGDGEDFEIAPDTGAVTFLENPDFETQSSYSFTVVATDAAGNSAEQDVSLTIIDQDDSAPFITSDFRATIDENIGSGQMVYTATATDEGTVTWGLEAGGDAAAFSIDPDSGVVTLNEDPDFETQESYTFTVVATDDENNSSEQQVTLDINDLDEIRPTVDNMALTAAFGRQNDTLNTGDTVRVTVTMSENTTVTGTPRVALDIGGETVLATFSSGGGTSNLVFTYTVQAGDTDSNGISIPTNALQLSGGSLADAAGNAAVLGHGSVPSNDSFLVDTTAPTVNNVALTGATGENDTLNAGDTVSVTVTMSENTTVTGTPRAALDIGGETALATFSSGSGTSNLVFTYTVQAGDTDSNGISIPTDALQLNGGSLTDAGGNAAVLGHGSVPSDDSFLVDTTAPTLDSSTPTDGANNVAVGNDIILTFSEDVLAGSGNITISDGAGDTRTIDVVADTDQFSISEDLVTIDPAADLNPGTSYNVQIDSGAFTDGAGNEFAGIDDTTTLNFDTETVVDTSVVVFDLVQGSSSDHSGRTFQSGVNYDIYIRVDSDSATLSTAGGGPGTWDTWSGAASLGSDDRIILVGDGTGVLGPGGEDVTSFATDLGISWRTSVAGGTAALLTQNGGFSRTTTGSDVAVLWAGIWSSNPNVDNTFNQIYLTAMPANVLTSQGLV